MALGNTRDKIVELAREYIQKIGYHSFNYKQIATQLNIKNAAIHHYFPSKEDLGLAVIEKDQQDFLSMSKHTGESGARERAESILGNYNQYFNDGNKLCIIGTFESAYNDLPEKIKTAAAQYLDVVNQWLVDVFKQGLESGEFKFRITPEEMADFWSATLPGMLQVGRLRGANSFNHALNALRESLKGSL